MPETIKLENRKVTLISDKDKKGNQKFNKKGKPIKPAGNITIRNAKLLPYAGRKATVTIELDDIIVGVDTPHPTTIIQ